MVAMKVVDGGSEGKLLIMVVIMDNVGGGVDNGDK